MTDGPLMMPRAIIFDLDGTLVDSLPDIAHAVNTALIELNLEPVDPRIVRRWIGNGVRVLCERALAHHGAPQHFDSLLARVRSTYGAAPAAHTTVFPNILKMLDLLREKKLPTAVLTNKPHALAIDVLEHLGLAPRIDVVKGYLSESDKKPSPTQALSIARALNVAPTDCVIVGDSVVDIQTARNAGMRCVAVTWGYQEKSDLVAAGPDAIIDRPEEIFSVW